jgi:hypothetical protein
MTSIRLTEFTASTASTSKAAQPLRSHWSVDSIPPSGINMPKLPPKSLQRPTHNPTVIREDIIDDPYNPRRRIPSVPYRIGEPIPVFGCSNPGWHQFVKVVRRTSNGLWIRLRVIERVVPDYEIFVEHGYVVDPRHPSVNSRMKYASRRIGQFVRRVYRAIWCR